MWRRRRRGSFDGTECRPRFASTIPTTATGCSAWWKTTRALMKSTASCGDRNGRAPFPTCSARRTAAIREPHGVTCFCEHCERKARDRGINVGTRPRRFRRALRFRQRPRAASVRWMATTSTLWRLMLRYPELLAWEMLWTDSLRETYAAMYQKVKSIKPRVGVGWHIWHNNSFSPIYRAEQDLCELSKYSDFLKMVMYHNCGGERMAGYIRRMGQHHVRRCARSRNCSISTIACWTTNRKSRSRPWRKAAFPATMFTARPSAPAKRSTARRRNSGRVSISIFRPERTRANPPPQGTQDAVLAAFRAGSDGVLLSRKYSEMRLPNLRGAGDAIRELGFA